MAKMRFGQKPDRVFKFLMGARHPKVARAVKAFGFSDEVLQEGWRRLEATAELALVEEPSLGPDPKIVKRLDSFENVWFTVVKATLRGNYPDVHDALFAKLSQVSGRDSAMTVGTFLKRVREMEAGEGVYAENGAKARELLAARGLTESILAEGEGLIAAVKTTVKMGDANAVNKAEHDKAVDRMWVWYLEWSAIARVAVKDRRLLRSMGFLSGAGGKGSEEEEALEAEDPGDVDAATDGKDDKDDSVAAE